MSTALAQVANRLSVSESELQNIVMNTVMPANKQVSNEQFISFIAVANEYKLNPLVKEIYAFPTQGGGIQPIVSIDGWLRIINSHKDFNGMTFKDNLDDSGKLISVTCSIFKKGIEHPVQVTEYMSECSRNTDPWKKWPARMLRHKAAIQGGRYAFGISGIIDPDEAERFEEAGVIDKGEAQRVEPEPYPQEQFDKNFSSWKEAIVTKKKTHADLIAMVESKAPLTEEQKQKINEIQIPQENTNANS